VAFDPALPLGVLIPVAVVAAVALVASAWASHLRGRMVQLGRRLGMVALVTGILLGPSVTDSNAPTASQDLDVFFVVDTSISMVAEDFDGDSPRLDAVRADIAELVSYHAGARMSLISFDTEAQERAPLTRDSAAMVSAAETLRPPYEMHARGTSIDAGLKTLVAALTRSAENNPERGRVVYYLGDGEQTSSNTPASFDQVAELSDGGAVLGYGTAKGGRMLVYDWLVDNSTYLREPEGMEEAISKTDEGNLKAIADEAGLAYTHRTAPGGVTEAAFSGTIPVRHKEGAETRVGRDVSWVAGMALVVLAAWELGASLAVLRPARREERP
jgi:Ca-activated chloride channel family protein